MSEALSSLRAPIDPGRGGVLLANMLASWLDHDRSWTAAAEARDESEDSRTAPPQAGLHLPAPVDAGPSSPPSGEYGAPVRLAREGALIHDIMWRSLDDTERMFWLVKNVRLEGWR